jgi:hypothetical protein
MRFYKPTLCLDFESVEGDLGNLDNWRKHDALFRADVLKDWIGLLQKEYEIALEDMNKEYKRHG